MYYFCTNTNYPIYNYEFRQIYQFIKYIYAYYGLKIFQIIANGCRESYAAENWFCWEGGGGAAKQILGGGAHLFYGIVFCVFLNITNSIQLDLLMQDNSF